MKTGHPIFLSISAGLFAFLTVVPQTRLSSPFRDLMRQKLDHSQSVLEGIVREDFELIDVHAKKLRVLSEQPGWVLFDTAEYADQSLVFKRNVDALSKAARARNLDAATLAYTKVTFSCVECHKYIRDRKAAALAPGD
jgi:hypothetical protein